MSLIPVFRSENCLIGSLSLILNLSIWTHIQKLAKGQWKLKLKPWTYFTYFTFTFFVILTAASSPLTSLRNQNIR